MLEIIGTDWVATETECGIEIQNLEMRDDYKWSRTHWTWVQQQTRSGRPFWGQGRWDAHASRRLLKVYWKQDQKLMEGASVLHSGKELSKTASVRTHKRECVHQVWHWDRRFRVLPNLQLPETVWEEWDKAWLLRVPGGVGGGLEQVIPLQCITQRDPKA